LDGDDATLEGLVAVDADALGDLTRAERIEALRDAVLTLPLQYREAVVLCDLQEMTYADAAAVLGCVIGTVRSRLHRGRALLALKLTARDGTSVETPVRQQPQSRGAARFGRTIRPRGMLRNMS
jgi:DNA-directed RNA polymerase specialized sigma24 family protein